MPIRKCAVLEAFSNQERLDTERMPPPANQQRASSVPKSPIQPHRPESAPTSKPPETGRAAGRRFRSQIHADPLPRISADRPPLLGGCSRHAALSPIEAAQPPWRPKSHGSVGGPPRHPIGSVHFGAHRLTLMAGESRSRRMRWGSRHALQGSDRDSGTGARP